MLACKEFPTSVLMYHIGCPKKVTFRMQLKPKNLKIECCGANFSHGHYFGALDPAQSQQEKTKQNNFHKQARPRPVRKEHCGSSSILKVTFLGQPVQKCQAICCFLNVALFSQLVTKSGPKGKIIPLEKIQEAGTNFLK